MEENIKQFINDLGSKAPTPGGGGAAALCGSLSSALGEMVLNLTSGKKKYAEYEDEIQSLILKLNKISKELLECIDKDETAFAPLAKAYSLPKDNPNYEFVMEECLKQAAIPPFTMIKLIKEVIIIDERLLTIGTKLAKSDVGCSAILAYSALQSAALNVFVNTKLMKDKEYAKDLNNQVSKYLEVYGNRALNVYNNVLKELNNG